MMNRPQTNNTPASKGGFINRLVRLEKEDMNTIDYSIIKIIEEPKQIINDDFCGWSVKVLVNCYGNITEKTFTGVTKSEINKYNTGYIWSE